MSFFTSLQNYVTSGVAGLGLSPRKFSLSRQDSQEGSGQQQNLQQQSITPGGQVPSVQLGGETVSGQKPISSTPVHGKKCCLLNLLRD
uniref:CSON009858 protein n=1 Tax=Culicoides sonorensis TaxID=179676 RepID=A0A336N9D4_CULSO